jgi:hypothetical protein
LSMSPVPLLFEDDADGDADRAVAALFFPPI